MTFSQKENRSFKLQKEEYCNCNHLFGIHLNSMYILIYRKKANHTPNY